LAFAPMVIVSRSRGEDFDENGFHRGGHTCSKHSPHGTVIR
jgi:hypothetical protein